MTEQTRLPDITATVRDTEAVLSIDGSIRRLTGPNIDVVRDTVRREVASVAARKRQPVRFIAEENGSRWQLIVHPDGAVTADDQDEAGPDSAAPSSPISAAPAPKDQAADQSRSERSSEPESASDEPRRGSGSPDSARPSHPGAPMTDGQSGPSDQARRGMHESGQPESGQPESGQPGSTDRPPSRPGQANGASRSDSGSSSVASAAARPQARQSWPPPGQAHPQPQQQAQQQGQQQGQGGGGNAVSFLPPERQPEPQAQSPAPRGWRERLFGTKGPDPQVLEAQRAEWADQALVSKHWPGPKTIAVVNGKGGSGKTPTTALLSAVFARYGGGGVIAWDNNDTRGTLGWRTASGGHERTVLDLIPDADRLMDRDAQVGQLAYYTHHQPEDKYDVLRSNPALLAQDQRLSTEHFAALHAVANRFYRLIFMDSGNDESTYAWLNMIEAADQIVLPTSTRPDHAEAGVLLLSALRNRNEHCRQLADRAVIVVLQADQDEADADTIAAGFRQLLPAENVVTIPYDRAIRDSQLRHDRLNPATQRAFLRAAAAVAGQL